MEVSDQTKRLLECLSHVALPSKGQGISHVECHKEYHPTGEVIIVFRSLDSFCHFQDGINRGKS